MLSLHSELVSLRCLLFSDVYNPSITQLRFFLLNILVRLFISSLFHVLLISKRRSLSLEKIMRLIPLDSRPCSHRYFLCTLIQILTRRSGCMMTSNRMQLPMNLLRILTLVSHSRSMWKLLVLLVFMPYVRTSTDRVLRRMKRFKAIFKQT